MKKCRKGRQVKVSNVGSTKSDKKGNWRVDAAGNVAAGTYQVTVKKKTKGSTVCKKAKKSITVR